MRMRAGSLGFALILAASPASARVVFLDDAERVHKTAPLPESVFRDGPIELEALAGEVVAFQAIVDDEDAVHLEVDLGGDALPESPGVTLVPFAGVEKLSIRTSIFSERFLHVARASGNERRKESLAFDEEAAPDPSHSLGDVADPLVPSSRYVKPKSEPGRAAFFVELFVDPSSPPGRYSRELVVRAGERVLSTRVVDVRVLPAKLPYPRGHAFAYVDPTTFEKRGFASVAAEIDARRVLHEHAIDGVTDLPTDPKADPSGTSDDSSFKREVASLTGELFDEPKSYGEKIGSATIVYGIYGNYLDPDAAKARALVALANRLDAAAGAPETQPRPFVYAIDESCESPRVGAWKKHLDDATRDSPGLRARLRVGVTCSRPARKQAAEVVFMTADGYSPSRDRSNEEQFVGVYNGRRPFAGAMVLDVPATDLLVNGWIAAKYEIAKWFYWESAFWFDGNRGGRGGKAGFDPLVVAETFHNADGDYQNGDGILLYPGSQPHPMTDLGFPGRLLPSLRLKMIRRGLEDGELIRLAKERSPDATRAIVDAIVPVALAEAKGPPSWPERGKDFFRARIALRRLVAGEPVSFAREEPVRKASPRDASLLARLRRSWLARAVLAALVLGSLPVLIRRLRHRSLQGKTKVR